MVQLINFDITRVTSLFLASSGHRQLYLPEAVSSLKERYKFIGFPKNVEEIKQPRVTFEHGIFDGVGITALDIYADGIAVSSKSNSDLLDGFLNDIYNWMDQRNIARIKTHKIEKSYDSRIVYKSDVDIPAKVANLDKIGNMINLALTKATSMEATYKMTGFSLGADAFNFPGIKPTDFRVDRRLGVPYESNLFYSAAPLPTNEHLKILNALEGL